MTSMYLRSISRNRQSILIRKPSPMYVFAFGAPLNQRKNEEKCFGLWAPFEPKGFDTRMPILCGPLMASIFFSPDCFLMGTYLIPKNSIMWSFSHSRSEQFW